MAVLRKWFMLEQGMANPREPGTYGWREWEAFNTRAEAIAAGRKSRLDVWRVLEVIESYTSLRGQADKANEAPEAEPAEAT